MSEEQSYFLRVEGVNLSNFVYDTKELSVIRGGGLLLLDAVEKVEAKLKEMAGEKRVTAISTGASSGLFKISTSQSADEIQKGVAKLLNDDKELKHATFVIDVIPIDPSKTFVWHKEFLLAKNRWQQMQSPTVAIPKNHSSSSYPCAIDHVRPIYPQKEHSSSVWRRKEYGREQKRGALYQKLTGIAKGATFTNDLGELSADGSQGNLNHKIAVIYADGNSFGALQRDFDEPTLTSFDSEIKVKRKSFLAELVKRMDSPASAGWKNGEAYRIETLLWGGDEFMLVVPAWKGWETLQLFYELSDTWELSEKEYRSVKKEQRKLTHSAGLVFCHHNAPIHRIKTLAHDLAEVCKNESIVKDKENYFAYQVLESFDHIAGDLEAYLKKMSIDAKIRPMILSGTTMKTIAESVAEIKSDPEFARGRLHSIVKKYRSGKKEDAEKEVETLKKSLNDDTNKKLATLETTLGNGYCWLHLADIYDYIVMPKKPAQEVKTDA